MKCSYCGHDERCHGGDEPCTGPHGEGCWLNCIGFMEPDEEEGEGDEAGD